MLKQIYSRIKKRFARKLFIQNITGGFNNLELRVLLYYKTEPLYNRELVNSYEHTNNWEIIEIVRILNAYGFVVDVVDRALNNFEPETPTSILPKSIGEENPSGMSTVPCFTLISGITDGVPNPLPSTVNV